MLLRASLSRCAVTWISASGTETAALVVAEESALAAVESEAAANTAELEVVRIKAVATHDAVGAVEKLGIRITPQKLKECELLPIARAVPTRKARISA